MIAIVVYLLAGTLFFKTLYYRNDLSLIFLWPLLAITPMYNETGKHVIEQAKRKYK